MRRVTVLIALAAPGLAAAQVPPNPIPQINATLRGVDQAGRIGAAGLDARDADPLAIGAPEALLPGGGCYASDDLAHATPYDPVFRDGALVCEDRRTVVPR